MGEKTDGSGERAGYRDAMDRMQRQLTEGGVSPEKAAEITRKAALRGHDGACQKK